MIDNFHSEKIANSDREKTFSDRGEQPIDVEIRMGGNRYNVEDVWKFFEDRYSKTKDTRGKKFKLAINLGAVCFSSSKSSKHVCIRPRLQVCLFCVLIVQQGEAKQKESVAAKMGTRKVQLGQLHDVESLDDLKKCAGKPKWDLVLVGENPHRFTGKGNVLNPDSPKSNDDNLSPRERAARARLARFGSPPCLSY